MRPLPPHRVLGAAATLALLVVAVALTLAVHRPGLGFGLRADGDRIIVSHTYGEDAAAVLAAGDVIVSLHGAGLSFALQALDLTPEPDMAFLRYADMDAFFARQQQLDQLLRSDPLRWELADGRQVELTAQTQRSLSSLPPVFWFQLLCAVGGLLAGASVWAFRRQDPATRYYALTGIGMLIFASAASVYSTRELALDGALFKSLSALNQFGALLFCAGLIAVLWHYPKRLSRHPVATLIVAGYVAIGLLIPLRWVDSVDLLAHLPITLGYFSTYLLAAVQWWKTRNDAYERAALRMFLLAWLFGSGAFVAMMYLPSLAGIDNGAIQGYAFGFFLLIHVGIAFGILRYKLFRLDRWWFNAWRLFFSGLGVIALDLALIYLLRIDARTSLLLSLAIAGWLYFPLRQWLWSRLARQDEREQAPAQVRRVTNALSRSEVSESAAWRMLLQDAYAPLSITTAAQIGQDDIIDSGLGLDVSAPPQAEAMRLRYCEGGARLFQQKDLHMLAELRRLFSEILRYRTMLEDGVRRERDRVARDLHDDVGARLLTMSHRLPEEQAQEARTALSELRSVVYSMRAPPISTAALLGQWQQEASERCQTIDARLNWTIKGNIPNLDLGGGDALTLSRVLREAISNALRHAGPDVLSITCDFSDAPRLGVQLSHRYSGQDPERWTASLGLHNLRDRLAKIGGTIDWKREGDELRTQWQVDLGSFGLPA